MNNGNWISACGYLPVHILCIITVYILLRLPGITEQIPNKENLMNWDAGWYYSICKDGYSYSDSGPSNSGFFPLFPWLWKLSGLNSFAISVINALIAVFASAILFRSFHFGMREALLSLSIPSMFFLFIPYTESLFLLFSVLILVGLKKHNKLLITTGLFLSSITRPTAIFFIPCLMAMHIFSVSRSEFSIKSLVRESFLYSLTVLAGLAFVFAFQYWETGVAMAYFKSQSQFWNKSFTLPRLPFGTWGGKKLIWLDGMAFLAGTAALAMLCRKSLKWVKDMEKYKTWSREIAFSVCYLAMTLLSIVFFDSVANGVTTSIQSINRYMFVSAFFMLFLDYMLKQMRLDNKQFAYPVVFALFNWLLFAPYRHIQYAIVFLLMTAYVILNMMIMRSEKFSRAWIAVYLINIFLQLYLFDQFMKAEWVG